ncbi:protein of unknown function (plasmid) [Cupriavidus taiwanensis]|uniref:Uncharacterized protein n=1 Tax=Cupriavidus taiwanensis TaxID=164546 RepID=A0A375IRY8_9BURK|nr:protein of unknown function [Cupriavidus taiwanensis]
MHLAMQGPAAPGLRPDAGGPAVMGDYLMRCSGSGSALRFEMAQNLLSTFLRCAHGSPPQSRIIPAAVCRAS